MAERGQKFSLKRRSFCSGLSLAVLGPASLAGCDGGGRAVSDSPVISPALTPLVEQAPEAQAAPAGPRKFVHPGLLHTEADFDRMRAKVAAAAEPWASGWANFLVTGRSHLGNTPRPLKRVVRGGDGSNFPQMFVDIARAYQLALRWKVSGDVQYADQAVLFLNAWSSTMEELTGNADRFLAAGIYGYEWCNAAEIMRTYSGWAAADFARFQALMLNVFYPMNHQFLVIHNGADITNYWANWDLCNIASMLAIGVLCDRVDLYDEAMNYYKTGAGNGASNKNVFYIHPGHLGQWQESGRDQGHCTLGIGLAASFCEMAWNQGDDMYGYDNNRFLSGAEYVAKSNLRDASGAFYSVPFATYRSIHGTQTLFSTGGQGHVRPVWEMVYHHYVNRKGLAAPYTALQVKQLRPEGDGGNGDQLGVGTLTFSRDPIAVGAAPSGLTAWWSGAKMVLSWWGSATATSYSVKRATVSGGPYTTIATGITDLLSYTDTGLADAIYFYVVTADGATGAASSSTEKKAIAGVRLHTLLAFDEGAGGSAADGSGNRHTGKLAGPTWVAGRSGGALAFDGVNNYVSLPPDTVADVADFTIATWVYWDSARTWERVFDFGAGTDRYLMLTPRDNRGVMRFVMTTNYGVGDEGVDCAAALPTGQWVHVAVTLSGSVGSVYVNGILAGTNAGLRHAPFRLGSTGQNWIGRSQYDSDPYFKGKIDDFRIYRGALDAAAVLALSKN